MSSRCPEVAVSSGVVLYLAIVVMWLCVLVPMWLHRDRNTLAEAHKDTEYAYDERAIDEDSAETLAEPLPASSADPSVSPSSPSSLSSSLSSPPPLGDDVSPSGAEEAAPGARAASETGPRPRPSGPRRGSPRPAGPPPVGPRPSAAARNSAAGPRRWPSAGA